MISLFRIRSIFIFVSISMSTFKRSPAYAEVVFKVLDSCSAGTYSIDVCRKFRWNFPGGQFGVRTEEVVLDHAELPTSGTTLPGGSLESWVFEMEDRKREGKDGFALFPKPIRDVLMDRRRIFRPTIRNQDGWIANAKLMMEDVGEVLLGMPSVYELCHIILLQSRETKNRRVPISGDFYATSREMYLGGSCSSDLSLGDMDLLHCVFNEVISKNGVHFLTKCISSLDRLHGSASTCRVTPEDQDVADHVDSKDAFDEDEYDWDFTRSHYIGEHCVTVRPRCVLWKKNDKCWVLGLSDIRKVTQYVTGVRNYIVGLSGDAAVGTFTKGTTLLTSIAYVSEESLRVADHGRRLKVGEHLELCKSYKAALAIVKANIAGEMSTQYLPALWDDISSLSIGQRILPTMRDYVTKCLSLPPTGALPLAKVFRLMPPPDVWIVDALRERWEKASVITNIGEERCEEFKESLKEVILTAIMKGKKYQLTKKEGVMNPIWWEEYMARQYKKVPTVELENVFETRGVIPMVERSRYDPKTWKDSGCGADTLDEGLSDDRPREEKNFLLRMMYDNTCPMPEDHYVDAEGLAEAGLKGESHKKRIYYSNKVASRLKQSRTDATVGDVMEAHPSFAIEKTGVERDNAFEKLSAPPSSSDYWERTGDSRDLAVLYYSFDIKDWSSGMASDIQKASHEVWDHFTGTKEFSETEGNHHLAKVYVNQDGVKAWYTNGSANFEGYNGKEMTALHIAIMTIAVRRLREALPDIDPKLLSISLQAYIDDGLAKLVLPKEEAMRVFKVWCDVVVDTWAEFGFKIERKKSFPSPAYFEFLGEEYYAGGHLATGSKAAMRITADPFEIYESLGDRVAKISSACRGSSVAGLPSPSAYLMQCYMVVNELRKWVKISDPTAAACWTLTPTAMGGLGMPGLFQQTTNASGASLEEGMNNLYSWALNNPAVRQVYVSLVRRGLRDREPDKVLSVPLGGQADCAMVDFNPVGEKISRALRNHQREGRLSQLGSYMMEMENPDSYKAFAKTTLSLEPSVIYQEALLNDLAEPVPQRINRAFINRFESARTISLFVGRYSMLATHRNSRRVAKNAYMSFRVEAGVSNEASEKRTSFSPVIRMTIRPV